jgi:hypothetical protein
MPAGTSTRELAGYVTSSFQGAILMSNADHRSDPIQRFKRIPLASTVKE